MTGVQDRIARFESAAAVAEAVGSALQVGLRVTIESEAGGRPVCVAEFLMRLVGT